MCHTSCLIFGEDTITKTMVKGKKVLEVGSLDVNGTLRGFIESMDPHSYMGVDIFPGKGVDLVLNAENLEKRFGAESFDLVVCTEMLEHARNWRNVIHNLKAVLRPGGCILITTRGPGFPKHDYPHDYWRYTLGDIHYIFMDFIIVEAVEDWETPGVMLMAVKPSKWTELNLSSFTLMKAPE